MPLFGKHVKPLLSIMLACALAFTWPASALASQPRSSQDDVVSTLAAPAQGSATFVYFEDESPVAGASQRIALEVVNQSGTGVWEGATLSYLDPSGVAHEVSADAVAGSALAFTITNLEAGAYELLSLTCHGPAGVTTADLGAQEVPCVFTAIPAQGESLAAEESSPSGETVDSAVAQAFNQLEELGVSTEIYGIDEDGELTADASLQTLAADGAADAAFSARAARATGNGTFVVALDPGHGGGDPGAGAYGLSESTVTLSIAKYCKAYLEAHSSAKVVMTRTTDEYVGLSERVERAVEQGADVFISIHINASTASSANGAEVWYPNASSYLYELHEQGGVLAQAIQDKLVALGLANRGIQTKNATGEWYYPDGSLQDYYTVIEQSRQNGIVGIIVEHGFVTNPAENAKLATDSFRRQLGEADAKAIIATYGLDGSTPLVTPASQYEWVQVGSRWMLKDRDAYVKAAWKCLDGIWYYLDAEGYALTGFQTVNGARYYFDESCRMRTGWVKVNGKWYFASASGALQRGWLSRDAWYYLDSDYHAVTGFKDIGGASYYFDKNCRMRTGWLNIGGKWYLASSSGAFLKGWQKDGGFTYFLLKSTGAMVKGNVTIGGVKRAFDASGALLSGKGWVRQNSRWYWLRSDGWYGTGWLKDGSTWYYLNSNGPMATGWRKVDGKWYWLESSGAMRASSWLEQGSKRYYLEADGAAATGWRTINATKYYFWPDSCAAATGVVTIDGKRYQFDAAGAYQAALGDASSGTVTTTTPIMGTSKTTVSQMVKYYQASGATYPADTYATKGASTLWTFCTILLEEAKAEGVRAEVVMAQAMKETGWLRYGGDVKIEQCNFCGLGATGGGAGGATFESVRLGLRAQVQHLKAYASTADLKNDCVDPRFYFVRRGIAPNVEDLSGKWATDLGYGASIVSMMAQLLATQ